MKDIFNRTPSTPHRFVVDATILAIAIELLSAGPSLLIDFRGPSFALASEIERTADRTPPTSAPTRRALLIGVDQYDQLPSLKYCSVDMHDLGQQLWQRGDFRPENISVLTTHYDKRSASREPNDPPTRDRILNCLEELKTKVKRDDIVLFAFSGHGLLLNGKSYLCPKNTPKKPTPSDLIDVSGQIYDSLSKCGATHKLVIIDACRSPPNAISNKDDLRSFQLQIKQDLPSEMYGLFSCSDGQESFESTDLKHGLFMHHVIEGIKGPADLRAVNKEAVPDGKISIHEWFFYASDRTRVGSEDRQTPEMVSRTTSPLYIASPSPLPEELKYSLPNGTTIGFRLVRRGNFTMGSDDKDANQNEKPAHNVSITSDFYLGETEVTQGQYESCVGVNPFVERKKDWVSRDRPVAFVSFDDAKHFCTKLSDHLRVPEHSIHLPSEAQWEYAARAGMDDAGRTPKPGVLKLSSWFADNSDNRIHQVRSLKGNKWGFYDMQGNVAEWVEDAYDAGFYRDAFAGQDPVATWTKTRQTRVVRGGAWISPAEECRTTDRNSMSPMSRESHVGFRVMMEVQPVHYNPNINTNINRKIISR